MIDRELIGRVLDAASASEPIWAEVDLTTRLRAGLVSRTLATLQTSAEFRAALATEIERHLFLEGMASGLFGDHPEPIESSEEHECPEGRRTAEGAGPPELS